MARTKTSAESAALAALGLTALLIVAKLGVWIATSSLAVLSQALDSVLDLLGLGLVFVGVRIAAKPADESHHYGHEKAENLAAFAQTLILGMIVLGVAVQAVARLFDDSSVVRAPWYALALLAASVGIDTFRMRLLVRTARSESSDALAAGALNTATDIGTAVVALVSLLFVRIGLERADAIGALVVAAGVGVAGVRLGKRAVDVLMDRAPQTPVAAIARAAERAPGVAETRRVRVRGGGKHLFADVTVAAGRTTSLERAHDIAEGVEREIAHVAPGADVVVHVEPASASSGLVERAQAAASRVEGVHEVHNVQVHSFNDGGEDLRVTLHAKVDPGSSVADAHALSDKIEAAVGNELGSGVRVDSHIEPLEMIATGTDVTRARQDVAEAVRAAALSEPEVIDCHEVLVTAADGELSVVAHVRGRAELALSAIHHASQRIEKAVHARHPEVGDVLIHFEPA